MPGIVNRALLRRVAVVAMTLSLAGGPIPASGATPVSSFSFEPPVPIAARGSLSSGDAVTLSVLARDSGGNPIPGATVWLEFFPTSAAGTLGSATACGKALGAAKSCIADGTGHLEITYTAGDAVLGADLIQVQDASIPTIAPANDSYCYNKGRLRITPAPMGTKDALLAGAVRSGAVTDVDQNDAPIAGATIYLSLAQIEPEDEDFNHLPANGSAKALSAGSATYTSLTLAAKPFVTDSNGQVPFFYRTPTALPTSERTDSLIAADKSTRGCQFSAHYDFLTRPGTRTDRIAGPDRYNTAAAITGTYSAPGTTDTVFIATGLNFPDALAGAAIAGHLGAPILLVNTDIPAIVETQLSRLKPKHIVILGGTGAVSLAIGAELKTYAPDVRRYGGSDRYDTARLIAQRYYPSGAGTVFIATGLNFPDALAGAAVAGYKDSPILLVPSGNTLSAATTAALSFLDPAKIVVLGGTGVVSAAQVNLLKGYAPVVRYGGADRYATASLIANAYFPLGADIAFVATGLNFPDALAGAAVAGALNAPIELVTLDSIPASTLASLTDVVKPGSIVVLGGTGVVSDTVLAQLSALP